MLESDDAVSPDSFVPRPSGQIAAAGLQRPNSRAAMPRPATPMYLDKNENPDPSLQAWYRTILQELSPESLSTYPDLGPLYEQLARWLGIPPEQLYLTAGCDGAIERTFGSIGDRRTDPGPGLILNGLLSIEQGLPSADSPTGTLCGEEGLHKIVETCGRTATRLKLPAGRASRSTRRRSARGAGCHGYQSHHADLLRLVKTSVGDDIDIRLRPKSSEPPLQPQYFETPPTFRLRIARKLASDCCVEMKQGSVNVVPVICTQNGGFPG